MNTEQLNQEQIRANSNLQGQMQRQLYSQEQEQMQSDSQEQSRAESRANSQIQAQGIEKGHEACEKCERGENSGEGFMGDSPGAESLAQSRREQELIKREMRLIAKEALLERRLPDFCMGLINQSSEKEIRKSVELIERLLTMDRGLEMPQLDESIERGTSYGDMLRSFLERNPSCMNKSVL